MAEFNPGQLDKHNPAETHSLSWLQYNLSPRPSPGRQRDIRIEDMNISMQFAFKTL